MKKMLSKYIATRYTLEQETAVLDKDNSYIDEKANEEIINELASQSYVDTHYAYSDVSFMIPATIAEEGEVWDNTKEKAVAGAKIALSTARDITFKALDRTGRAIVDIAKATTAKTKEYSDKYNRQELVAKTKLNTLKSDYNGILGKAKQQHRISINDKALFVADQPPESINDLQAGIEAVNDLGYYLSRAYLDNMDEIATAFAEVLNNNKNRVLFSTVKSSSELAEALEKIGFITNPEIKVHEDKKERGIYKRFNSDSLPGNRVFTYTTLDWNEKNGFTPWELLNAFSKQSVALKRDKETVTRHQTVIIDTPDTKSIQNAIDALDTLQQTLANLNRTVLKREVKDIHQKLIKAYTNKNGAIAQALAEVTNKAAVEALGDQSAKAIKGFVQGYDKWTSEVLVHYLAYAYKMLFVYMTAIQRIIKQY
nr:MAG TPA: hypothetical protein [Caudoviricetes sp.]